MLRSASAYVPSSSPVLWCTAPCWRGWIDAAESAAGRIDPAQPAGRAEQGEPADPGTAAEQRGPEAQLPHPAAQTDGLREGGQSQGTGGGDRAALPPGMQTRSDSAIAQLSSHLIQ